MINIRENEYGNITENKYFKQVTELTKLYDGTLKLYNELAKLEKNGLKDSEEYNSIKELISFCLNNERKYFSKIETLNSKEMDDLIQQICDLNCEVKIDENVNEKEISKDEIILNKTDLYTTDKIKRLLSRIKEYTLKRVELFDGNMEEEIDDPEYELYNETKVQVSLQGKTALIPVGELEKLMNKYTGQNGIERTEKEIEEEKLNIKVVNDAIYFKETIINMGLLNAIEEEIQKTKNKQIKNKLIDYKYNLIYNSETLEKYFILGEKDKENYQTIEIPVDFNKLYTGISYKIKELAKEFPTEYKFNYNDPLEEEAKKKIAVLKSKTYDETVSKEMNKLDNIIDNLYIKSLISAIINKKSLTNIIEYANIAENDPIDLQIKNNLADIRESSKELKLKL